MRWYTAIGIKKMMQMEGLCLGRWGRKSTYRNGNYFVGCAHLVFL